MPSSLVVPDNDVVVNDDVVVVVVVTVIVVVVTVAVVVVVVVVVEVVRRVVVVWSGGWTHPLVKITKIIVYDKTLIFVILVNFNLPASKCRRLATQAPLL